MKHTNYANYSKQNEVCNSVSLYPDTTTDDRVSVATAEETTTTIDEPKTVVIGAVIGCNKLNLRKTPDASIGSNIKCTIAVGTEVVIKEDESTDEFYKICLSSGDEGYCMRKYITIRK